MHLRRQKPQMVPTSYNTALQYYFPLATPEEIVSELSVRSFCQATAANGALITRIVKDDDRILQPKLQPHVLNKISLKNELVLQLIHQNICFDEYLDGNVGRIQLDELARRFEFEQFRNVHFVHESDYQHFQLQMLIELSETVVNPEPCIYSKYRVDAKDIERLEAYIAVAEDYRLGYASLEQHRFEPIDDRDFYRDEVDVSETL